jgi:RimJ/RimL family protein N-acetyltransferase
MVLKHCDLVKIWTIEPKNMADLKLSPITAADEDFTVRLECDPVMMSHIGGPRVEADVRATHKHRLALMAEGLAEIHKILVPGHSEPAGTIGIWKIDWEGPNSYEMGWFVIPEHQGRGIATDAAKLLMSSVKSNADIRYIHAYPTVANFASNTIARKMGMKLLREFDNEGFAGILRCNDWFIDLQSESSN